MAEKKVPVRTRRVKTPISSNVRNDILEAAVRVFSQKTFEGASLSEIAQAANISHPLVHYHFGSKEKLWKAAVDHVWSNLRHDYRAIIDASVDIQPIDTLKILCRAYGSFAQKYPQHIGMITNEIRTSGPRFDWLIDNYILPIHQDMNEVIRKAMDMGQVKNIPMEVITLIMFVSISHFFSVSPLLQRIYGVDSQDKDAVKNQIAHSIDILFNGISPR